jgi:hypothetical protein
MDNNESGRNSLPVPCWNDILLFMNIEAYEFGTITIDGNTYTRDLKIIAGRVIPNWWRKEGHNLLPEDIEDILKAKPGVLVVGTGHDGMMHISRVTEDRLAEAGIELVAKRTRDAVAEFNRLADPGNAAFAAHLTC